MNQSSAERLRTLATTAISRYRSACGRVVAFRPTSGYSMTAALVCEGVMTLFFLISIRVTNTSISPARSTGVALFAGGWAIEQRWLFWLAPIVGAVLGALTYRAIAAEPN